MPRKTEDLKKHDFIGLDIPYPEPHEGTWLAELSRGARVSMSTNSTAVALGAANGGAGITLLPRFIGDWAPNLRRIAIPTEPTPAVWLTVHKDLQHAAPVRSVLDFLGETFRADRDYLRYGRGDG